MYICICYINNLPSRLTVVISRINGGIERIHLRFREAICTYKKPRANIILNEQKKKKKSKIYRKLRFPISTAFIQVIARTIR